MPSINAQALSALPCGINAIPASQPPRSEQCARKFTTTPHKALEISLTPDRTLIVQRKRWRKNADQDTTAQSNAARGDGGAPMWLKPTAIAIWSLLHVRVRSCIEGPSRGSLLAVSVVVSALGSKVHHSECTDPCTRQR